MFNKGKCIYHNNLCLFLKKIRLGILIRKYYYVIVYFHHMLNKNQAYICKKDMKLSNFNILTFQYFHKIQWDNRQHKLYFLENLCHMRDTIHQKYINCIFPRISSIFESWLNHSICMGTISHKCMLGYLDNILQYMINNICYLSKLSKVFSMSYKIYLLKVHMSRLDTTLSSFSQLNKYNILYHKRKRNKHLVYKGFYSCK